MSLATNLLVLPAGREGGIRTHVFTGYEPVALPLRYPTEPECLARTRDLDRDMVFAALLGAYGRSPAVDRGVIRVGLEPTTFDLRGRYSTY
jgi:hypothetical protein